MGAFRYVPDIGAALDPWRDRLGLDFDAVAARLMDRDRQLEDYLRRFLDAPWQPYTPANTNVTVGNGTETARWSRQGTIVHFQYQLTWGSTTAFTGTVQIGLPVTANNAFLGNIAVSGLALDTGTPANNRALSGFLPNATQVRPVPNGGNVITATAPFTWVSTDILTIGGTLEAAS